MPTIAPLSDASRHESASASASASASPAGSGAEAGATAAPAGVTSSPGARRTVHYPSLAAILKDVESFADGPPVVSVGRWTPAQNIEHVRRLIHVSRAGAEFTLPLPLRLFARLLKSRLLAAPLRSGLSAPHAMRPPEGIGLEEAIAAFRDEVRAASRPGAMSQPSPLLGRLTHEQWEQLHCRHAELHFSHIVPAPPR